jgi:hypothetical protein
LFKGPAFTRGTSGLIGLRWVVSGAVLLQNWVNIFFTFFLRPMELVTGWGLEVERRDCEAVVDTFGFCSPRVSLFFPPFAFEFEIA